MLKLILVQSALKIFLKFIKINSCSISSQNIVTFVEISQFFLWKRNMIRLTKIVWISILTSLQRRQIEKYHWNQWGTSIFKITSNRWISKNTLQTWSNIKNTVRIKTSWLLLHLNVLLNFSFNDFNRKIKRFANSEPNTNTVVPETLHSAVEKTDWSSADFVLIYQCSLS